MIFASDLDRTLIFSTNSSDLPDDFVEIEDRGTGVTAFMERGDVGRLSSISKVLDFVPVTARSVDIFKRIDFETNGIYFKYAVTDNGYSVYVDGELDREWDSIVKSNVNTEMMDAIYNLIVERNLSSRVLRNLYSIEVRDISEGIFEKLEDIVKSFSDEFELIKDIKGYYILCQSVTKRAALEYVHGKLGYGRKIVCSGDSLMDLGILEYADLGLVCDSGHLRDVDLALLRSGVSDYRNVSWVLDHVEEFFGLRHKK